MPLVWQFYTLEEQTGLNIFLQEETEEVELEGGIIQLINKLFICADSRFVKILEFTPVNSNESASLESMEFETVATVAIERDDTSCIRPTLPPSS